MSTVSDRERAVAYFREAESAFLEGNYVTARYLARWAERVAGLSGCGYVVSKASALVGLTQCMEEAR